ncbi:MAG TPA: ATP-binding protein [Gemmatimonadales bacterium]|nr:ATP-binding protein [Gemmatimonadales bacterium]
MTSASTAATPSANLFLTGGGEMGALIRELDWSATALGPVEDWPQSLRSALSICLGSRFPIVIYWGPSCTVLYNDSYAEILGRKHPWALGRPCCEVWSEIWDVIAPMLQGVLASGHATWSEDQLLILERRGYPEECYFSFSFSPVRGADGAVDGIFTAVIENTRRVLSERRLRTLRSLAARVAANQGEQEAWQGSMEALAENPHDLPFALLYRAESEWACAQLVASRGVKAPPPVIELPCHAFENAQVLPVARPGGAPYGYLVAGISPRRPLDEDYRAFLALLADHIATGIANARALEEERERAAALAEIDRAKTAFFSNVSHEFRTPLTLMLSPLEDALAESGLDPAARDRLELIRRNGLRLQKLVNTLLDFARIEAGRAQATYVPTDLAALTADLVSSFRSAVEKAGLRLIVDAPALPDSVYVDQEMWEKIVLNLVSNAFKFTFEGEIVVSIRAAGNQVDLVVRDTGTGIPAAELPHIFERFHRVAGGKSRTHEGTGIGLALVSELVKLHGGTIAVQSREGMGTTFTVSIPLGTAHLPADRVSQSGQDRSSAATVHSFVSEAQRWLPAEHLDADTLAAPALGGARARIVWADDNADMRDYVRRLLSARYDVETVPNGAAALAAVRAQRPLPDLVLADVMMPELDGFGLLRELRADRETRALPVILLSARAGEESRIEGIQAGADDYLVKPFSRRELLACVEGQLRLAELRRETGAALRQRSAQFETLLNQAPLGVYLVDADFRIRAVNPVALPVFGDIPGGVVGRDFDEIMHLLWEKKYADEVTAVFRHTLNTGEPYVVPERGEFRLDRGVMEYYEWRLDRIPLLDGRYGVVCYFRDISVHVQARKALEASREALREADRRKDEFLATLSHELRNPLAPLRNALQVLRIAEPNDSGTASLRKMMERQVNHLIRLVDDLLEMSRISRGTLELRTERVDVNVIASNAIETNEPQIIARGHVVNVALAPEEVWVQGDPVRLTQAIGNLINNAAKYTAPGGQIWVSVRRVGFEVLVSVRDNGAGIGAEALPRIFDLFHRGDRLGDGTGLGIGLTLVRNLVEMHGGTVNGQSEGPGRGSEFSIRLPLASSPSSAAVRERRGTRRLPPQRILIVDDNKDAADSLQSLLSMLGANAEVAHDGPGALQAVAGFQPEIVLLDIGMPGMSGYDIARRIRQDRSIAQPVIVALTGWGQPEVRRQAQEAGFDHHLIKPVDLTALQEIISVRSGAAAVS